MIYREFHNVAFKGSFRLPTDLTKRSPNLIQVVWIGGGMGIKRGTYTIGINKFKHDARLLEVNSNFYYVSIDSFNFRKEH